MTRLDEWRASVLCAVVDSAIRQAEHVFAEAHAAGLATGDASAARNQMQLARAWAEEVEEAFMRGDEAEAADLTSRVSLYGVGHFATAGFRVSEENKNRAKKPRGNREVETCIKSAIKAEGSALDCWKVLKTRLENAGFIVTEEEGLNRDGGLKLTYLIELDDGKIKRLAYKTLQNRRASEHGSTS